MSSVSTFGAFTMAKLGIYASQKAMQVTGNNITNVNTEGYTRQELKLQSLYVGGADRYSSRWDMKIGSGVLSTGVAQIRSPYLDIRYRTEQSNVGMMDTKLAGLTELSRIFDEVGDGEGDEGVMEAAMQGLIEQLEYYSSEGAGKEEFDTIVRGSAQEVVSIFNKYASRLEQQYQNQVRSFRQDVETVNTLLSQIQKLNNSIRKAQIHGSDALELQDERNMCIDELSRYVRIDVMYEAEDIGAGYTVDKLVIKLDSNDPNGNDGAFLIDGKYATRLRVDDLDLDEKVLAANDHDFMVTLETLRDINGNEKGSYEPTYARCESGLISDLVAGKTPDANGLVEITIAGFTAKVDPTMAEKDIAREFADQFNKNSGNTEWEAHALHHYVGGYAVSFDATQTGRIKLLDDTEWSLMQRSFDFEGNIVEERFHDGSDRWVPDPEVPLTDNDLYGSLQASREMLTEKGEFATAADLALDPDAESKYGIPYYRKIWDAMAQKFADVLNGANTLVDTNGRLLTGNDGNYIVKPENYYDKNADGSYIDVNGNPLTLVNDTATSYHFVNAGGATVALSTVAVRGQFRGGVLFSSSGDTDSTAGITAKNIAIAHSWANGSVGIMQSRDNTPEVQSTQNSNLRHMVSILKDNNYPYNANGTTYFNGSFGGMLTKIASTLANDTKVTQARLGDFTSAANELYMDRDSVSGVDLNDEAISMMQYNKSYAAACRLMTTLDEMLDKLINGTAV